MAELGQSIGGAAGAAKAELQEAADDFDARMHCLQPGALSGPVRRARAALDDIIREPSRDLATAKARAALAELSGVPGADAMRARERLSRALIGLLSGKQVTREPEAGPLGPVSATCSECGEEFAEPTGIRTEQQTMCRRCRRETKETPPAPAAQEGETTMGAEPLRLETLDGPAAEPVMKECSECHAHKPIEAFSRNGNGWLGKCKECVSKAVRVGWEKCRQAAAAATADGPETPNGTKHCNRCNQDKPLDEMVPDKRLPGGLRAVCKECEAARIRARRSGNGAEAATAAPVPSTAPVLCPGEDLRENGTGPAEEELAPLRSAAPAPDDVEMAAAGEEPGEQPVTWRRLRTSDEILAEMRASMPRFELPPAPTRNWAVLAAPAMLAAGVVGLAGWLIGRARR